MTQSELHTHMLTTYDQTTHFLSMQNLDALIFSHFKKFPKCLYCKSKLSLWIKIKAKKLVRVPIHLTLVQKTKSNIDWSCQHQEYYLGFIYQKSFGFFEVVDMKSFPLGFKSKKSFGFFMQEMFLLVCP